ncbi:hypothetical protein Tco_1384769 [Tanacetum coccineum]
MILPVGYFLRAVINARLLLYFLLELSVFVLQVVHTWRHPSIGRSNYPKLLLLTPRASLSSFSVFRDSAEHQASGSGSGASAEVSVSSAEGIVEENVIPEGAFLNPTDPECDVTVAEKDVAQKAA